jgi:hypothetical protein
LAVFRRECEHVSVPEIPIDRSSLRLRRRVDVLLNPESLS